MRLPCCHQGTGTSQHPSPAKPEPATSAPHLRHVIERGPRQPKVADLELAVRVGQDVLGFEVTVEHLGAMDVLQATQHLVQEKLVVLGGEVVVGLDDLLSEVWRGKEAEQVAGCICLSRRQL